MTQLQIFLNKYIKYSNCLTIYVYNINIFRKIIK